MVWSRVTDSETYHRENPSWLADHLYLSGVSAISSKRLKELGITYIINATLELPTMAYQKQESMQIAVEDRVASKLYIYFDIVADKINSVHRGGGKVMIYCRAGMSRSASLCIAYFMRYSDMSLEDAYNYVRKQRPIIHPNVGFMRQLKEYEAKVQARKSRRKLIMATLGNGKLPKVPNNAFALSLVFATEVDVMEELALLWQHPLAAIEDLDQIPKRPKPRIVKPKLVDILELKVCQTNAVPVLLCNQFEDFSAKELSIPDDDQSGDLSAKELSIPDGDQSGDLSANELSIPDDNQSGDFSAKELSIPEQDPLISAKETESKNFTEDVPEQQPDSVSNQNYHHQSVSSRATFKPSAPNEAANIVSRTSFWLKSIKESFMNVQSMVFPKL